MISFASLFGTLLVQLPVLAVLVAGLVLVSSRRRPLPGRSATLAKAGLGVLIVESVGALAWSAVFPLLIARLSRGSGGVQTIGLANGGVGLMLAVVTAAGLGLLLAALLAARPDPAGPGPAPYDPAPYGSVPPDGR